MRYLEKSFTLSTAGTHVTQQEWDRIFGSPEVPEKCFGADAIYLPHFQIPISYKRRPLDRTETLRRIQS